MKYLNLLLLSAIVIGFLSCHTKPHVCNLIADTILVSDTIQYHPVRVSKENGSILPWFSADKGQSYDTVIMLVWNFWKNMETDSNSLKYYMNHQVWKPEHDMRGLGGDQVIGGNACIISHLNSYSLQIILRTICTFHLFDE